MTCIHLRKLYELCEQNDIKLSSAELVHVVCTQCGQKEVCPSMLMDEFDWDQSHPPVQTLAKTPAAPVHPQAEG